MCLRRVLYKYTETSVQRTLAEIELLLRVMCAPSHNSYVVCMCVCVCVCVKYKLQLVLTLRIYITY